MAYDEALAKRVSEILVGKTNVVEKKMFGGVGYLLNGNMACGINKDNLIVRVGPNHYQDVLKQPNTRIFDLTGRPMTGWVMVLPAGIGTREELEFWVAQGVEFAENLAPK